MRVMIGVAMLALLAGCGADGSTTAPPRAALTPVPTVDGAELISGTTYTTGVFEPHLRFEVPAGKWTVWGAQNPNSIELDPAFEPPVQNAALAFHHDTRVFDPAKGGVTPGEALPAPADFAAWLTEHPHLRTTKPEPVDALGLHGVSIDVRVKSAQPRQYKDCGKVEGDCVVLMMGAIEPIVYGETSRGRFYVLELPEGGQLVVEQAVEPPRTLGREAAVYRRLLDTATLADR